MSKTIYIATLSGGKDSTAMVDLLLKNGYSVDYIIFNDTLIEYKEMYEYIDKLDKYFLRKYNIKITRLKPNKKPEDTIFRKVSKKDSKWYGQIKGIFSPVMGFCEWRTEAKIRPLERFIKENNIKEYKIYFGFTIDERKRANRNNPVNLYPLIDIFEMSEQACMEYLANNEMENPLYRHFTRTGCRYCPAQSKDDKFKIWKYYPEVWREMREIEQKLRELESSGESVIYNNWHLGESIDALEEEFKKKEKQPELPLETRPLADCFCKL